MDKEFNYGMYADQSVADEWSAWVKTLSGEIRDEEIYPYLSNWIAKHKPSTILEIGSGTGVCSEKVDISNSKYIGVEPSVHLRVRAQSKYPDKVFLGGKAEQLPIDNNSMDAVFSVFVWLHIENLDQAAAEIERVLKPGGVFAIVTANPDTYDIWKSWQTDISVEGKKIRGNLPQLKNHEMFLHTKEEFEQSFTKNSLVVDQMISCGFGKSNPGRGFGLIIGGYKAK